MDLRERRTRKLIREAFFELMREKGFETLSVQDITERAMVNRSTFYRHYQDKYDLARKCLDEPFSALLEQMDMIEPAQELAEGQPPRNFLILFEHIQQNADLYSLLFGRSGISMFISRLREYVLQLLRFRLQASLGAGWQGQMPREMFEEYLAGAYIGVMQWWLDNPQAYTPRQVAYWLYQLVVQGTSAALAVEAKR